MSRHSKNRKVGDIVMVEWIDAQRIDVGVQYPEDITNLKALPCEIVGFLVKENNKQIILAQERWNDIKGIKYVHIIPKISIVNIVNVKNRIHKK